MKEALLVESGFVEVTQPKQFPVQRSVTADPNEMLTLKFFCGSSNRKIKGLVWEEDGFLLIYKRLEAGTFQWPRSEAEARNITSEQYHLLMSGYSMISIYPFSQDTMPLFGCLECSDNMTDAIWPS